MPFEDPKQYFASCGTPPQVERRGSPRVRVGKRGHIRLLGDGPGATCPVFIDEMSASGIGLVLDRSVATGREFLLIVYGAAEVVTHVHYRTVRCAPLGGGRFGLGAVFVRSVAGTTGKLATAEMKRIQDALLAA